MGQAWASAKEINRQGHVGRILAISGHLTVDLSGAMTPKGVSSVLFQVFQVFLGIRAKVARVTMLKLAVNLT
jgi:hypothetical protein